MIKKTLIMLLTVCSLSAQAAELKPETKNTIENFPMIFSQMTKMVGEKETVDILIPKDSYLIEKLFPVPDEKIEKTFGIDFSRMRRGFVSEASSDIAERIIKTVETEHGKIITINLKGLKLQTLRVVDDKSNNIFFNEYELADSMVIKAKLILAKSELFSDYDETTRDYNYLAKRYSMFLDSQHFNTLVFDKGRVNTASKIYASTIIDNKIKAPYSNITLTVMKSDMHENYDKIIAKLSDKALDAKYKQLNEILQ